MKPFSSFLIFLYGGKHHEWASLQWNRTKLARSMQTCWKMALTLQDLLKEDRSEDSKMRHIWNILAVLMPNHHISWRTEDFSWTWSILPFGFFFLHVNLCRDFDSLCLLGSMLRQLLVMGSNPDNPNYTHMSFNAALEVLQPHHKRVACFHWIKLKLMDKRTTLMDNSSN